MKFKSDVADTITSGKTSRMPKTATRIPKVRNSFCQKGLQFLRTEALTTALSKDSETSMIPRTVISQRADHIVSKPPFVQPHHAATGKQMPVTMNGPRKIEKNVSL